MSTILSKEQLLFEKIDNYVKDKLSEDEKDLLWVELCQSEELIDRLEIELLLTYWAKSQQQIGWFFPGLLTGHRNRGF